MARIILFLATTLSVLTLHAEDEMKVSGKLKFYNIGTYKQAGTISTLDSNALSVGGQIGITSTKKNGWFTKVNMMTTNGLFVNSDASKVDGSILANDTYAVSGTATNKRDSISVVGEAFLAYENEALKAKLGRQIFNSPLASAKDVRMIPSTFSGANVNYRKGGHVLSLAYFDGFKQRTSDRFYNILEHALGTNTMTYTGQNSGALLVSSMKVNGKFRLYNYNMDNFINSTYIDYKNQTGNFKWAVQAMYQMSVGNFDTALKNGQVNTTTYSQGLQSSEIGAKISFGNKEDELTLATTYTGSVDNAYSDIVAPFDGTPLFTDTITGNNLFKSQYGAALNADSGYTADTLSFKAAYKHAISKSVKSFFAIARFDETSKAAAQTDFNAVISWKVSDWNLAAKAIYVLDNSGVADNKLQQYRLIATHTFKK